MERILTYTVLPQWAGYKLYQILLGPMAISQGLVRRLKHIPGSIRLNGLPTYVCIRVKDGDIIQVTVEQAEESSADILPVKGELDIRYEDEDLLVVNKPALQVVHPSPGHYDDSLANVVQWYYANQGKRFVFRSVNRLDRGTSGLMLIAKNGYTHHLMMQQMHTQAFCREYLAICASEGLPDFGTIDAPIARKPGSILEREISDSGQHAVTHYWVEERRNGYALIKLRLETGRTHQIRVHMASLGYPLIGDFLYGQEDKKRITRQALHSFRMRMVHPMTGENLEFSVPMPEDMRMLMEGGECDGCQ